MSCKPDMLAVDPGDEPALDLADHGPLKSLYVDSLSQTVIFYYNRPLRHFVFPS